MTDISSALRTASSGAKVVETGAQGAALGAGLSAGKSAWEGVSTAAFLLFVLGLAEYFFFRPGSLFESLQVGAGVLLSFFAAYCIYSALLHKESERTYLGFIVILVAFWLWFAVFGSSNSSLLYIGIILGIILIVYLIRKKDAGAQSVVAGVLAILVFFLETGVIFYYSEILGLFLPTGIEQFLVLIPWWAFVGWLSLLPVKEGGPFVIVIKIAGGVALLLIFAMTVIPNVDFTGGVLPTQQQILASGKNAQDRVQISAWDVMVVNWNCYGNIGSETNVRACIEAGKKERMYELQCEKEVSGNSDGLALSENTVYQKCLKNLRTRNDEASLQVAGTVDGTIREPLTAELEIDAQSLKQDGTARPQYVAEFVFLNPRFRPPAKDDEREPIVFKSSCYFDPRKEGERVVGVVDPSEEVALGMDYGTAVTCTPSADLEGSYTLVYRVELLNVMTSSRLERAFIGSGIDYKQKEKLREEISRKIVVTESAGPADPARIDFDLGHVLTDPVIEYDAAGNRKITLRANVKNTGRGTLTRIQFYEFRNMDGFEPVGGDVSCLRGGNIVLNSILRQREVALPACRIDSYPAELKPTDPEEWIPREFYADIVYDYLIEERAEVVVRKPMVVSQ